jgi:hypothetical protein
MLDNNKAALPSVEKSSDVSGESSSVGFIALGAAHYSRCATPWSRASVYCTIIG